jgi:hypothetical protein
MRAKTILVLAASVVLASLAVFAIAAFRRPAQSTVHVLGRPVAAIRRIDPAEPQFGDPVTATIEVVVDERRVDPRSVRVDARFAPYVVTTGTRSLRRADGFSIVQIVDRLDCLDSACLPKGAAATLRFPRLRVAYPGGTLVAAWPPLRTHARVQPVDLAHPTLRVGPPRAHATYRLPPRLTGWVLLAAAFVSLFGGLMLLVRAARPWLRFSRRPDGTTVEQILAELAGAGENGDTGRRRRTLERLARELEPLDEPLSFESHVLAWAPHDPGPEAISDLADRVRTVVNP